MSLQYEYLGRRILGGGVDDDNIRTCTFEEYYRLMNIDDLTTFVGYLPSSGMLVQYFPAFRIKTCELNRISEPRSDHKVDISVKYKCSTLYECDVEKDQNNNILTEMTPPWLWRIQNFQIVTESEKSTTYNVWPSESIVSVPLANSAGVLFDGTVSRGLAHISFSYNLQYVNPDSVWLYVFKTNAYPAVVAGLNFPERTLLINKIEIRKKYLYHRDGSIKYEYYNVSLELLADPQSFNKPFPNLGDHIMTQNGLARLWTWGQGSCYGTLAEYILSEATDGEEVGEPVYLAKSGTCISPFVNGQQAPVYLIGSLFQPINYEFLKLPKVN